MVESYLLRKGSCRMLCNGRALVRAKRADWPVIGRFGSFPFRLNCLYQHICKYLRRFGSVQNTKSDLYVPKITGFSMMPHFPTDEKGALRGLHDRNKHLRVKNRRKRYLDLHPEYFEQSSLELAGRD